MATAAPSSAGHDAWPLLRALHAGPLESPPWGSFVAALRERANAVTASFSFRFDDRDGPGVLAAAVEPGMVRAEEWSGDGLHAVIAPPGSARVPSNRFVDVVPFIDRSIAWHVQFEQEILARFGIDRLLVARVRHGSEGVAWLSLGLRGEAAPGTDHQFDSLLPHVEIALRTFAALDRERSRALAAANAVQRLNLCWLKLDLNGRIIDLDPQAEALLAGGMPLRQTKDRRLVLASRQADEAMRAAIAVLGEQPDGRARAVHVSDQPWLDMLLVRARGETLIDTMEPGVIAYVHGEPHQHADRRELLRELFGLSPKEAQLAIALSRGRSIAEAAVDIGLSEGSAREYTKRIYGKTGTRGQADLVRLILTSVAALA